MKDSPRSYREWLHNDETMTVYDKLLQGIELLDERIIIRTDLSVEESFDRIAAAVDYDNPQLYYVDFRKLDMSEVYVSKKFWGTKPAYSMSRKIRDKTDSEIDMVIGKVLCEAVKEKTFEERYWTLYKWLMDRCESVDYKDAPPEAGCITGPFLHKTATCEGYAKSFKYLSDKMNGMLPAAARCECVVAVAENPDEESDEPGHAWNIIFDKDGEAHHCDIMLETDKYIDQDEAKGFMLPAEDLCGAEEPDGNRVPVEADDSWITEDSLNNKTTATVSITINGAVFVNGNVNINIK